MDSKHTASEYNWIPVGSSKGGKAAGSSSKSGKATSSSSKGGKASDEGSKASIANAFEALSSDDEDFVPMEYKTTWILDSASSGNYGDRRTKVKNRLKLKRKGISVNCANNTNMEQKVEGEIPFPKIPEAAKKV